MAHQTCRKALFCRVNLSANPLFFPPDFYSVAVHIGDRSLFKPLQQSTPCLMTDRISVVRDETLHQTRFLSFQRRTYLAEGIERGW